MGELNGTEDYWLEGGVDAITRGGENGFLQEVDRVIDLLGTDESWLAWWRRISDAPTLEVHMMVLRAEHEGPAEERVLRGRKRHLVEMRIDLEVLEPLEPDERRLLALPAVLEGVSRARSALNLSGEIPKLPDDVRPAPLSPGVIRRRRLRELRGETNAPLPDGSLPGGGGWEAGVAAVRSVLRPEAERLSRVPAVASQDPIGGELVVEIHVPLDEAGGILPGDPGYEFGWIDGIEEFLDDESSDGSFDIYDGGEEVDDAYVFFVAGATAEVLLRVAAEVAVLPGVPSGAFAVVTDDQSEETGTGLRVALN
ncbi:hypothetical protein [Kribbella sp. CA-293567]|uniref:hypothetical protein n=1 Tax=Kribbella sp. CA-293567 TaxID=3002436 RepID=UPI0022DD9735|nr:hypothetical protein [Kribbella sp. CA-293567]WBQ04056.1 hypothetical protein OX958_29330 [Kribbella sp. CA-293567]